MDSTRRWMQQLVEEASQRKETPERALSYLEEEWVRQGCRDFLSSLKSYLHYFISHLKASGLPVSAYLVEASPPKAVFSFFYQSVVVEFYYNSYNRIVFQAYRIEWRNQKIWDYQKRSQLFSGTVCCQNRPDSLCFTYLNREVDAGSFVRLLLKEVLPQASS